MQPVDAQESFARLTETLLQHGGVTAPEPGARRRFGSTALTVDGSIFAMLQDDRLVVKLPRTRVESLVAGGAGEPFGAGRGRGPMAEWVAVVADDVETWLSLSREALEFVEHAPRRR